MRTVYCPMCGSVVGFGVTPLPEPELCESCAADILGEVEEDAENE